MKKAACLAIAVLGIGLMGSMCDTTTGGGGGGLFGGAAGSPSVQTWDMLLMLGGGTYCPDGFPAKGAGLEDIVPPSLGLPAAGMFPGIKVKSNGYDYTADVPEIHMLNYFVLATGIVNPGDTVKVHFIYQTEADGADGDFFLARIIDGDRFRVPAQVRGAGMADTGLRTVDFTYTAQADGFGLQLVFGLSGPLDRVVFDELEVTSAGLPLFSDYFESADIGSVVYPVAFVVRAPSFPLNPAGSAANQAVDVLQGAMSLEITGGRYFQLGGLGASTGGYAGLAMSLYDPAVKYHGDVWTVKNGGMYVGTYSGYGDQAGSCTESGSALVAVNPTGNADLSGQWTLTIQAQCSDASTLSETIVDLDGPGVGEDPITVAKSMIFFSGVQPIHDMAGNPITGFAGFTMGKAGMFMMTINYLATDFSSQLVGSYDKSTSVFAGQIIGAVPKPAGGVCVIPENQGAFYAVIY